MNVIEIDNLSFGYPHGKQILNGVTMSVKKNSIYGFIGANGAGKSTTIRIILGLLKSKIDEIHIFGKNPDSSENFNIFKKIGFLIDKPVFYNHLTCEENLILLSNYYDFDKNAIDNALSTVGLINSKKNIFHKCSTGMKQRLAIAKAIVHKPEVLILDEPFNGLDPEWTFEIRSRLKELNNQGMTIFYSSHLLGEMEKLVTDIGILKNGKIIIEAPVSELFDAVSKIKVVIQFDAPVDIQRLNFNNPDISIGEILPDNFVNFQIKNKNLLNELIVTLVKHGYAIKDIQISKPTLEDYFLKTAI